MKLDEYNVRMQAIYSELADISTRTKDMAVLGNAYPGHAPFDIAMSRQDALIRDAILKTSSLLPLMDDFWAESATRLQAELDAAGTDLNAADDVIAANAGAWFTGMGANSKAAIIAIMRNQVSG